MSMRGNDQLPSLDRTQVLHDLHDAVSGLTVSNLIIRIVTKEFIAPRGHSPQWIGAQISLPVDEAKQFLIRNPAAASRVNFGQIRPSTRDRSPG